jgi:hypothetical protein
MKLSALDRASDAPVATASRLDLQTAGGRVLPTRYVIMKALKRSADAIRDARQRCEPGSSTPWLGSASRLIRFTGPAPAKG